MDNENRRLCDWFEVKVDQKFEISDQEGNHLGQWTLTEVTRLSPVAIIDDKEQDSYWLKFNTEEQWHDGLYHLKSEDGEGALLFANSYSATEMQVTVN